MSWLQRPPPALVIIAAVLALWPVFPAPYLIVKIDGLLAGEPLDGLTLLRLLLHGAALLFLVALAANLLRQAQHRR